MRVLTWSDLRARLEAAYDLRASMNGEDSQTQASFDAGFAHRIASRGNGKDAVNPSDLVNGKGNCLKDGATQVDAPSVSRGNT